MRTRLGAVVSLLALVALQSATVAQSLSYTICVGVSSGTPPGTDIAINSFGPRLLLAYPGFVFSVGESTRNSGTVAVPATTARYYIAKGCHLDPRTARVLGDRRVPALNAGDMSEIIGLQFAVPKDFPPGLYCLAACADADSEVQETNKSNNCTDLRGFNVREADAVREGARLDRLLKKLFSGKPMPKNPPPGPCPDCGLPWPLHTHPITVKGGCLDFLVDLDRLADGVLRECIGIQELDWNTTGENADGKSGTGRWCPPVPIYARTQEGFQIEGLLGIDQTFAFQGGRYPATAKEGEHVQIVIDPYKDRRVWIRPRDMWALAGDYAWFCLDEPCLASERKRLRLAVDPISLLAGRSRIVYTEPADKAQRGRLPEIDSSSYYVLTEVRDGFGHIASTSIEPDIGFHFYGWIRIRDGAGHLTIWPYVPSC